MFLCNKDVLFCVVHFAACVLERRESLLFHLSLAMVTGVPLLRSLVRRTELYQYFVLIVCFFCSFAGGATLIFEVELLKIDRKEDL